MVKKQDGCHFVNHWKTEHHWKTEQTPTIEIQNVLGIPAPDVNIITSQTILILNHSKSELQKVTIQMFPVFEWSLLG